jgi:hypothetical protein
MVLLSLYRKMLRLYLKVGYNRLLPHQFQIIHLYQSLYHCTMYNHSY